jgi:AcrR family transcriptional regulator
LAKISLMKPGARREALLQAAAEVFFEQGYAAASIDAIIERAGGSKRNIYNAFGSKEGLFAAIVDENASQLLSTLDVGLIEGHDLEEMLTAFGKRLLDRYTSSNFIGLYRIAVCEAPRFPGLVKVFHEQGPGRATQRLADVLEAAKARGEIQTKDCMQVSRHFVGMIRDTLLQALLGIHSEPAQETVASAVELFLNGIRVRPEN